MKIPQTTNNVGAYYGNEENGQWQPNGVIIDSGVGGGVVGSGDHRPPVYPLHMPRPHIPAGYVMAGAFYPPAAPYAVAAAPQDDFEDYMWMENEEEFDKQVMQQLEEEALMEQCIEAMLEDEQRDRQRPPNGHTHYPTTSNGAGLSLEETVSRSTLNPLAAEFVPTARLQPPPAVEERTEPPISEATPSTEAESNEPPQPSTEPAPGVELPPPKIEPTVEPPTETPEVSAADVIEKDKRPKEKDGKKDSKTKVEVKKTPKQESKVKAKPQVVKSEPKVAPKKKESPKVVKSEVKVEEKDDLPAVEPAKPQQTPSEETSTTGFKPINYAAAARAMKPKKPTTPPAENLTKAEKKPERKVEKPNAKPEKVAQRKNSAK